MCYNESCLITSSHGTTGPIVSLSLFRGHNGTYLFSIKPVIVRVVIGLECFGMTTITAECYPYEIVANIHGFLSKLTVPLQ